MTKACDEISPVMSFLMVSTHEAGDKDILCEDDSLSFDDEEVDEVLEILERSFQRLLRNSVVLSWSDTAGNARAHDDFACNLCESDNCVCNQQ